MNLKTREERVQLLKMGFFGTDIEKLYNIHNKNIIVHPVAEQCLMATVINKIELMKLI